MRESWFFMRSAIAVGVLLSASGCGWFKPKEEPVAKAELAERKEEVQDACASSAAYEKLKRMAFDEAIGVPNADAKNLETLANSAVVRMETPVAVSRDEVLNVTNCTGRFILELPPGAERGFGGDRRLVADIAYTAHAAADGSGFAYRMSGAEPIVARLAAFDMQGRPFAPPVRVAAAAPPLSTDPTNVIVAPAPPSLPPQPSPAPPPPSRPIETARDAGPTGPNPSFNCRYAQTRSERMVCGDAGLARQDRSMASLYYSAMADADGRTRAELRRTRDRFLAYRERCPDPACVAEAYGGRMREIRDIVADGE
ncbi:lysozyme inhibitor LprI family protein [Sphingomonas sp.]|uniref:lysozyme inhibitor LprI family protein n=1 Tax=Sphingomonas sp. TaxID=28214 RepID=UPI002FCAE87B